MPYGVYAYDLMSSLLLAYLKSDSYIVICYMKNVVVLVLNNR